MNSVGVKVTEEKYPRFTAQVFCEIFNCVYGWLPRRIRVFVKSVQVLIEAVHSEMPV